MSRDWSLVTPLHGTRHAAASQRDDTAVADAAIARVLAAEAAARDDVATAEREAEALRDDARRRARRIAERGERRTRDARRRHEAAVAREVARLEAESDAQGHAQPLTDADRARIERAVAAVAAMLTGSP